MNNNIYIFNKIITHNNNKLKINLTDCSKLIPQTKSTMKHFMSSVRKAGLTSRENL